MIAARLAVAIVCAFPLASLALKSDRDQPIRVSSDSVDVNQKHGLSKYSGNVILIQGTLRIEANEVLVYFRKNKVDKVFANGKPVKFRQRLDGQEREIEAAARRVQFYVLKNQLDLFDDVVFQQGQDTFRSPVVRYNLNTMQLIADGGNNAQRVHSVLQPRKKKSGDRTETPEGNADTGNDEPPSDNNAASNGDPAP